MKCKNSFLLYQIGIDQYKLKSPYLLRNNFNLFLDRIYLVIISKTLTLIQDQFVQDVIFTLGLINKQVILIKPKDIKLLNNYYYIIWQIGIDNYEENEIKLNNISDSIINTPSLKKLKNSVREKRLFWYKLYTM